MKIALKDLELRENQLLEQERKVMCEIVVLLFQRESLHTMLRILLKCNRNSLIKDDNK